MGKYTHLTDAETISQVENFGTDDEKELLKKILGEPDWGQCPECERREVIFSKCYAKLEGAIEKIGEAQTELE